MNDGIPSEREKRLAIANRIMERAAKMAIPPEDVIIDPLKFAGMVRAADLLLGRDICAKRYLAHFRSQKVAAAQSAPMSTGA